MKDSINSTYMGQERIAQTIPCMSTSNKPSYVSYFQICRHLHRISMVTIQLKCDFNSHFSSKLNLLYEQREETDLTLWLVKWQSQSNRSSGTFTRASFGSMVQKGKFSAGIASFVTMLKKVDLPTFGNPTCRNINPEGV